MDIVDLAEGDVLFGRDIMRAHKVQLGFELLTKKRVKTERRPKGVAEPLSGSDRDTHRRNDGNSGSVTFTREAMLHRPP